MKDADLKSNGILGEKVVETNNNLKMWQELRYGMFIHLGLYSCLGGVWKGKQIKKGYSEQIQMWADIPLEDYEKVSSQLTLEKFDPKEICSLAKEAGMNYIVITTKHHDGFCMFKTKTTNYNVVNSTPFGKDVIDLLSKECQKQGLKFGLYFSLIDWYQGHEFDPENNNTIPTSMEPIIEEQLTELMTNYGPIVEVWFDMSSPTKIQSNKFKNIVRKYQPEAAINGRIWNNEGDFRTLDDNQVPAVSLDGLWQTPASIYSTTWGYRSWQKRTDLNYKVINLLKSLIAVRARGGNFLLNIGPKSDGSVVPFEKDVLRNMGQFISEHSPAILWANSTKFQSQPWGEITGRDKKLYLHVMNYPNNNKIILPGIVSRIEKVTTDGTSSNLSWKKTGNTLEIELDEKNQNTLMIIQVELVDILHLIPQNTIPICKENDIWNIDYNEIDFGYNYADQGNYTSLVQSNIRQSIYLLNDSEGSITIKLSGEANANFTYAISVDTKTMMISGEDLVSREIGPFEITSSSSLIPINILLANPSHPNQDLELDIRSVKVIFMKNN